MKQLLTRLCATVLGLLSLSGLAQAQYVFKNTPDANSKGLAPYEQNFDKLSGTNAQFVNNETLPGVYANFTLNSYPTYEFPSNFGSRALPADNGSKGSSVDALGRPNGAGWYHFGSPTVNPTDRALGGIAATTTDKGVGYIGIRLRNGSGTLIKNLDISYAMEQWFNSGKLDKAEVKVAFRKLTGTPASNASLIGSGWKDISELYVQAPSTSAAVTNSDGNSPTNRRVKRVKLFGGKTNDFGNGLADGEEIMIRWSYVFDSESNGNGLSLDDVTITPETNIFYSKETGRLNDLATWGINADGTGTRPASFNLANTTYYVRGKELLQDRLNGALTISGTDSRLVVGTPDKEAFLYISSNDNLVATVNVEKKSILQIGAADSKFTLGSLDDESQVEYISPNGNATQLVKGGSYGKIKFTKAGDKVLAGNVIVGREAKFDSDFFVPLRLRDFDFTLLKEAKLEMDKEKALFVTDGKGGLRQSVGKGDKKTFLVAATANIGDQTRAVLTQEASNAEDTYKVRVIDGAYAKYDADENPTELISNGVVKKTWFISEEVVGGSEVTVETYWNKKDEAPGFLQEKAYVDHYTKSKNSWDRSKDENDGDIETNGVPEPTTKGKQKKGVKNFSPFSVTSITPAPLPVQLVSFDAKRKGTAVVCNWATASELNNASFEVERMLDGQTSFRTLGRVAGSGTTTQGQTYSFLDAHPSATIAYYRLRQIDVNGTSSFSSVVAVAGTGIDAQVSVVPNPSTGQFELRTNFIQPVRLQGRILNTVGRQVQTLDKSLIAGTAVTLLDLSNQPAGVYILQLRTSQGFTTLRLVKQ